MNNNVRTNHLTMLARITNRLTAIKELPIAQLELRQPMLVDLLVNLVDYHTDNGKKTDANWRVTAQDYWTMLKEMAGDAGFKFLGAGHFSAAFKHEQLPQKVIKIGFKKEDSGAAYAAYCRANPNTVGLPTIHALARHNSCYSVVLDELQSFRHANRTDTQNQQYDLAHEVIDLDQSEVWEEARGDLNEFERSLLDTAKGIRQFFYGVGSFDLHTENVMLDKWGRLVITDPVSYTNNKLEAVEFDALCEEIAAYKLEQQKSIWKARHQRKHPTTATRRIKKAHVKRKRKQAKERKAAAAKRLADINLSDLECLAAVHGLPHEAHLQVLNERIEAAPKGSPSRQAMKAVRMGLMYGAPLPNFVHAMDAMQQREGLFMKAPRFDHPRIKRVKIDGTCAGLKHFAHMLKADPKMFNVPPEILKDAAIGAELRDRALNQALDARFIG